MSRIQRVLTIYTSLGQAFNYTLQATVPPHTLSKCAASLPRPDWENALYYIIISVMGFFLVCMLFASYFEADRIFVADILKRKVKLCNGGSQTYQKEQGLFDLKNIGVTHNGSTGSATSSVKPTPLPANLINKFPRPLLDIPNGHIQHKSRDTFWTSFTNGLKSLFIRKPATHKKKVDNNNLITASPVQKTQAENKISTTTAVSQSEKDKPVTMDTITPEKSNSAYNQPQQKVTQRKTKAAKRTHSDSTAINDTHSTSGGGYDRKHVSRTNSTTSDKREANNTVKDLTPIPNVTLQSSTGLDTFDDIKVYESKYNTGQLFNAHRFLYQNTVWQIGILIVIFLHLF